MRREKSCGAALFRRDGERVLWLVERMRKGHVSLCKGHVEGNETEHETAAREIMEETALSVRFIDGFRKTIGYSPEPDVFKDVVFFLAEAADARTRAQESEVASIAWLPEKEALDALTYAEDRGVLSAAAAFLSGRGERA